MTQDEIKYCAIVCANATRAGWQLDLGELSRARWKRGDEEWQLPLSFEKRTREQLLLQACRGLAQKFPELQRIPNEQKTRTKISIRIKL